MPETGLRNRARTSRRSVTARPSRWCTTRTFRTRWPRLAVGPEPKLSSRDVRAPAHVDRPWTDGDRRMERGAVHALRPAARRRETDPAVHPGRADPDGD